MQDLDYDEFEQRVWWARFYQYRGGIGSIDDHEQRVEREWRERLVRLGYDVYDVILDEQHRLGSRR